MVNVCDIEIGMIDGRNCMHHFDKYIVYPLTCNVSRIKVVRRGSLAHSQLARSLSRPPQIQVRQMGMDFKSETKGSHSDNTTVDHQSE